MKNLRQRMIEDMKLRDLAPGALVKQASDRCIIDPAGTYHEQKKGQCFS